MTIYIIVCETNQFDPDELELVDIQQHVDEGGDIENSPIWDRDAEDAADLAEDIRQSDQMCALEGNLVVSSMPVRAHLVYFRGICVMARLDHRGLQHDLGIEDFDPIWGAVMRFVDCSCDRQGVAVTTAEYGDGRGKDYRAHWREPGQVTVLVTASCLSTRCTLRIEIGGAVEGVDLHQL